jgi:uncharacterized protein (DUF1800 family)
LSFGAVALSLAPCFPGRAAQESGPEIERARLLVSRATYGARPGDVERVLELGTDAWLERQLHPERIDDSALESVLSRFADLDSTTSQRVERYPRPGREEREAMQEARERIESGEMDRNDARRMRGELVGPGRVLAELSQAKVLRALRSERQLEEVMVDFWSNHFNVYARKNRNTLLALPSYERDAIRPHVFGRFETLLLATARHPAMLVYLDNWINTKEGFDPRQALRSSMRERSGARGRSRPEGEPERTFGINENYGRELLELHTLGVDGGYTQADVVEAARALTGWSVVGPRVVESTRRIADRFGPARVPPALRGLPPEGSFWFNALAHDEGAKTILGERLEEGGIDDGLALIRMLARQPQTARFVSRKLAQRFVSDDPSEELVAEMSTTFLATGGEIRAVLGTMFRSPRFVEEGSRAAMVKTPLELVASALRATSAEVEGGGPVRALHGLGMPPYLCQPPTGYDDSAPTWLAAGNVLTRIRFVGELVAGRIPGVAIVAVPHDTEAWARQVLPRGEADLSSEEQATLSEALGEFQELSRSAAAKRMALVLASPAFQRQ